MLNYLYEKSILYNNNFFDGAQNKKCLSLSLLTDVDGVSKRTFLIAKVNDFARSKYKY